MEQFRIRRIAFRSVLILATAAAILSMVIQQALQLPPLPAVAPAPPLEILRVQVRLPPVPPPPPPLKREGIRDPDWAGLLMQIHRAKAAEAADASVR